MHEEFEVKGGGPLEGQKVALDKGHDEELILMEGKVKHIYRTVVRHPREGVDAPVLRALWYVGRDPFGK